MTEERHENHVRIRRDGHGDAWANAHRTSLSNKYFLHDIDAVFGLEVFGANTGDRLFLEYEPDHYNNREKSIREFAAIALFDRKASKAAAFSPSNRLSLGLYLWQCRSYAKSQPIAPRFFFVIGQDKPPWLMIEIDIQTAEPIGHEVSVDSARFSAVWDALGLTELRNHLRSFVAFPEAAE